MESVAQMVRIIFIGRLFFVGLELGVLFAIASGLVDIPNSLVYISSCFPSGRGLDSTPKYPFMLAFLVVFRRM